MDDRISHADSGSDSDPIGDELIADAFRGRGAPSLLREALLAHDAVLERASSAAAPDAGRVAGHFAGFGDSHLLDEAAQHPSVRRLLSEVANLRADDLSSETHAGPARCSDVVRARALSAFLPATGSSAGREPVARRLIESKGAPRTRADADADAGDLRAIEPSFSSHRPARRSRIAIAAAILLLPAAGFFAMGRTTEAATLALEGLDRVDAAGAIETNGPRRISMGERVAARPGERVALRLVGGTRVVLGDRAQLSVNCDAPCDGRCGGAVFDVETGPVSVAAASSSLESSASSLDVESVALRVPSAGRVDVLAGAVRMDRDVAGDVSLFLRSDARVRWSPASGVARELVGPALVRLVDAAGAGTKSASAPHADTPLLGDAAFRDLDFFGGSVRRSENETRVGARRWRIRSEDAIEPLALATERSFGRRSEAGGAPAIRFDLAAGSVGRVAWPADAPVYEATRVEVRFRALCHSTAVRATSIRVRLEGVDSADAIVPVASLAESSDRREPCLERAVFDLPAAFAERVPLAEIVISFVAADGDATLWFESAVFLGARSITTGAPPATGMADPK